MSSMSISERPSGSVKEGVLIECASADEDEVVDEVSLSERVSSVDKEDLPEAAGDDGDVLTLVVLRRLGVDLNAARNLCSASLTTLRLLITSSTPRGGTYLHSSMIALYNSWSSPWPFSIVNMACMTQVCTFLGSSLSKRGVVSGIMNCSFKQPLPLFPLPSTTGSRPL